MKKTLLSLLFGAFGLAAGAQDIAADVAGDYAGDLWVSQGAPVDTTDEDTKFSGQTITLSAGDEAGTIDFALYNFTFGSASVGNILLPAIPVSTDADGNVLFGENPAVELALAGGLIMATAQINTEGSVISGNSIEVAIDVVWTNGGNIPINVLFKGEKSVTDGIGSVAVDAAGVSGGRVTGVYTLDGRRVNTTGKTDGLPVGLYIVNGQKTIIK